MSDVETEIIPPELDEDGDGEDRPSTRIGCHVIDGGDVSYDAAVQLHNDAGDDPAQFADGLLGAALAVAHLRGPDFAWAVMERFSRYDGGTP